MTNLKKTTSYLVFESSCLFEHGTKQGSFNSNVKTEKHSFFAINVKILIVKL